MADIDITGWSFPQPAPKPESLGRTYATTHGQVQEFMGELQAQGYNKLFIFENIIAVGASRDGQVLVQIGNRYDTGIPKAHDPNRYAITVAFIDVPETKRSELEKKLDSMVVKATP